MTLQEIIEKCRTLRVCQQRCMTEAYNEIVFYTTEIDEWNRILADILGPAIKPSGEEPTEEDLRLTRDYGGVWTDQTLFKREFDEDIVIAMFWPWQDRSRTTLKMAVIEKEEPGVRSQQSE